MELVQEVLEAQSFLRPNQIIEYMAGQFTDRRLGWEDFYDIMIGVFGKGRNPLSKDEIEKQMDELLEGSLYLGPSEQGRGFYEQNHGLPYGRHLRFYLNAHDHDGRRQILESIVSEFKDSGFKVKSIAYDLYGFSRLDNTLLYVGLDDAVNYAAFLRNLSIEHAECFDSEVPLLTKKLGKGISYAVSPIKGQRNVIGGRMNVNHLSYSSLQSMLLQRVFDVAIKDNIEDLGKITELYQSALLQVRLSAERPYMHAGMVDPVRLAVVGSLG